MSDHFKGWQDGHLPPPEIPEQKPAEQIKESGGQVLDIGGIANGEYLKRSGTDIVGDDITSIKESGGQILKVGSVSAHQFLQRSGTNIVGYSPSVGCVTRTSNQSIGTNAWTKIRWNSSVLQSHSGMWSSANNTRLVCKVAGWYTAHFNGMLDGTTANVFCCLYKNGSYLTVAIMSVYSDCVHIHINSPLVQLAVNDYLEAGVYHIHGSARNFLGGNADNKSNFYMERVY